MEKRKTGIDIVQADALVEKEHFAGSQIDERRATINARYEDVQELAKQRREKLNKVHRNRAQDKRAD